MTKKNKSTIAINGQRYDALTGAHLSHDGTEIPRPARPKPPAPAMPKAVASRVVRHPAKPAQGHAPTASRTLMRHAVHKPQTAKRHLKAQGHTDKPAAAPLAEMVVGQPVGKLDSGRLRQAGRVAHNQLISHFSASVTKPHRLEYTPPPAVAMPPTKLPAHRPAAKHATKAKTTADLLDQVLQTASGHRQPPVPKKRRGRHAAKGAAALLALLLVGAAGWYAMPGLRLHAASAKAGFSASLPAYHPAGYSLSKLDAGPGIVASRFGSHSDGRAYTITQKESSWNSQDLRDKFVAPAYAQYQTVQAGSRTVYLYGDGNATWVDTGVWYVIQSNGSLGDRQLIELAESL